MAVELNAQLNDKLLSSSDSSESLMDQIVPTVKDEGLASVSRVFSQGQVLDQVVSHGNNCRILPNLFKI